MCVGTCIIFPDNTPGDPIAILRVCSLIAKACCPIIQNVVIATISNAEHTIEFATFVLADVNGFVAVYMNYVYWFCHVNLATFGDHAWSFC